MYYLGLKKYGESARLFFTAVMPESGFIGCIRECEGFAEYAVARIYFRKYLLEGSNDTYGHFKEMIDDFKVMTYEDMGCHITEACEVPILLDRKDQIRLYHRYLKWSLQP